jgi:hypothetical protein
MSSKEQAHSNKKESAKKQTAHPEVQNVGQLPQHISPLAIQLAKLDLESLTPSDVLQLQRVVGNKAISQLLADSSKNQSAIQDQTIQRERDESGNIVGLDMATCSLVGVHHEETKSSALVESKAWMSSPTHSVVYEIKWDAEVVPGGSHLGQVEGQASDWVVDKSADGEPIGDRENEKEAPYFNNDLEMKRAPKTGRFFWFPDDIKQRRLRGGSWWFRLKVIDEDNNVLSQSHDVEVPWGD